MIVFAAAAAVAAVIIAALLYQYVSSLQQKDDSDVSPDRRSFEGEPWWERAVIARRMSIDAGLCRVCGKPTQTRCSRCKQVKYCSPVCQRKDWGCNHKFECENLQKQAALAAIQPPSSTPASKPPPLDPNEDAPVPQQVLFPYQHYLQLWHKSSSRRPPVGLTNPGNNCYANACLQCLLINKPLRAYLDQGLHTSSCNKPHRNEWCLLCELQVLCRRLSEAGPGDEVSARPLLRHLRKFSKTLSYGRQEDAHDFFYSLVMTMEAIQLTNYGGKERFDVRSQETTLVHHAFAGYMRNQVVCGGCGAASRRFEVALDLTLALQGADKLEDALAQFTAEELLDGENRYACDGCKQRCPATKWTRFEVAPNSLVLNLKRYGTGRFGKINKMLVYGETLDLGPYMADGAMDPGPVTYTLAAVLVHLDQMNSTSFGHYICFVRASDGRWYVCDDANVAPANHSRLLSQNAYMLFYQRDTPKPAPQPGFKRHMPLLPPTAAQMAALTAVAAAKPPAQQQQRQQQQQPLAEANGIHVAVAGKQEQAAAAQALLPSQHSQQQQQQVEQQQVEQQQQQQQVEQPSMPLSELVAQRLARVSTAPAALVRFADEPGGSSSSREAEEPSSLASPSCSAEADVSEDTWQPAHRASLSSSSVTSSLVAEQPPEHGTQHQHQQQQQHEGSTQISTDAPAVGQPQREVAPQPPHAAGGQDRATPAGPAGDGCQTATPDSTDLLQPAEPADDMPAEAADPSLPVIEYKLSRSGPELLNLRARLPGVSSAADVAVDVVTAGPMLQRLQLKVPGKFAVLDVPLNNMLQAHQAVSAVGGKLYRRRQLLHIKLHLVDRSSNGISNEQQRQQQQSDIEKPSTVENTCNIAPAVAAAAGGSSDVGDVIHWHSTDTSCDTSSGSESDGLAVPMSSFHQVMSEMDLSSFFGRQVEARTRQMMQELRGSQAGRQQAASVPEPAALESGPAGSKHKSPSSKKGASKKGGKSKKKK